MTPTLLAYQIDPKKLGKMQIVCLRLGIRVQAVDPADFGQTIGALAGVLPLDPDARAAHIPPVALKAMLTDTNAAWTAPALYAEIAREHAAMHGGGRTHKA